MPAEMCHIHYERAEDLAEGLPIAQIAACGKDGTSRRIREEACIEMNTEYHQKYGR